MDGQCLRGCSEPKQNRICHFRVRAHRAVNGAGKAVHDGVHRDRHPALHALRGQHWRHPGQGLQVDLLKVGQAEKRSDGDNNNLHLTFTDAASFV